MKIDGKDVIILHDEEIPMMGFAGKDYEVKENSINVSGDVYEDLLTGKELFPQIGISVLGVGAIALTAASGGLFASVVATIGSTAGIASSIWGLGGLAEHYAARRQLKRDIIYDEYTGNILQISELDSQFPPGAVMPNELNSLVKDFSLKNKQYAKLNAFYNDYANFHDYIDMQLGAKEFTSWEKYQLRNEFDNLFTQSELEAIRLLKPADDYIPILSDLEHYYREEAERIISVFEPSKEYLKAVEENKEEQEKQQRHENDIVAKQTEMANAFFEQQKREQAKQAIDNAKVSMQTQMAKALLASKAKASQTKQSIVVSSKKQSVAVKKSLKPVKTVTSLFNSLSSKLARGI